MNTELSLARIKEKIPPHCFEKSLPRSLSYMVRDLLLLSTAFFSFDWFSQTWIGLFLYWNIYGFLMWCVFVVGHDCGHGTFSKYKWINDICGHICHGILFVPYWPWAYSHKKHHMFHNHVEKDQSHPWISKEKWRGLSRLEKAYIFSPLTPFIAYYFYLFFGLIDGSHILPFSKLYKDANKTEKIKCVISTLLIIGFGYLLIYYSQTLTFFFLFYGGCWVMFSFWLFLVTYMQHHKENSIVFDDNTWNYLDGALETIDRSFGFGIDNFHHNITDGHVIHHLFFTQIPHYRLKEATYAVKELLEQHKVYHHLKAQVFFMDFFKLFFKEHFTNWKLYKRPDGRDQSQISSK